nr:hypothetical protein [Tanacetum cinerariifolium]
MINQCFSEDSCEEILSSLERLAVQQHCKDLIVLPLLLLLICSKRGSRIDGLEHHASGTNSATSLYKSNGLNVIGEHLDLMA